MRLCIPSSFRAAFHTILIAGVLSPGWLVAEDRTDTDEAVFEALGYAMGMQMRLNAGFSETELDALFDGMTRAATGAGEPDGFDAAIREAQNIYMQRVQTFQMRQQAEAQEIAAANREKAEAFLADLDEQEGIEQSDSGLRYRIIDEGSDERPGPDDTVLVSYRGTLVDEREFDSNAGARFPVSGVIPGFSEGLQMLGEGGKAKLYVPPDIGYGDNPQPPGSPIEPGSLLIFDVHLVRIEDEAQPAPQRPSTRPGGRGRPSGAPSEQPPPPPSSPPPPPPDDFEQPTR